MLIRCRKLVARHPIAFLVASIFAIAAFSLAMSASESPMAIFASSIVASAISMLAFLALFGDEGYGFARTLLALKKWAKRAVSIAIVVLVFASACMVLARYLLGPASNLLALQGQSGSALAWISYAFEMALTAIREEALFSGMMLISAVRAFGMGKRHKGRATIKAVALVGVLFAIMHLDENADAAQNAAKMLQALCFSTSMCTLALLRRSIVMPCIAHFAFDAAYFAFPYASALGTGAVQDASLLSWAPSALGAYGPAFSLDGIAAIAISYPTLIPVALGCYALLLRKTSAQVGYPQP